MFIFQKLLAVQQLLEVSSQFVFIFHILVFDFWGNSSFQFFNFWIHTHQISNRSISSPLPYTATPMTRWQFFFSRSRKKLNQLFGQNNTKWIFWRLWILWLFTILDIARNVVNRLCRKKNFFCTHAKVEITLMHLLITFQGA